jgi:hypothetical protein
LLRGTILINVEISPGKWKEYPIKQSAKIEELKNIICKEEGISKGLQSLSFFGEELENDKTLSYYNIRNGDHVYLTWKLTGGGSLISLTPDLLDEPYHFDFTNISDVGVQFCRGGVEYIRPCGWQRFALKVRGRYPDDIWLEGQKPRFDKHSSAEDEWPVSYHGTSSNNGLSIAGEGFRLSKGRRFLYGNGIYSTPDIKVALKYSESFTKDGKTYKLVMQNRVNPQNVRKFSKAQTGVGEYWLSPSDDDIRPYGFCIRETNSSIVPTNNNQPDSYYGCSLL